jgi:hypothetical protein
MWGFYPCHILLCIHLQSVFGSCFLCLPNTQHGQETLDSLAKLKALIMTRYEQYEQGQAYHSSLKAQAPVFNPTQQLLAHPPLLTFMAQMR